MTRVLAKVTGQRTHQHGFTLIEMMIVIAIGGVLLTIAVNAYGSMREDTRVESAKEAVVSVFHQARLKALTSGESQSVTFNWANDTVTYDGKTDSFAPVDFERYACSSNTTDEVGGTTFTFSRRGTGSAQSMKVIGNGRFYSVIVNGTTGRVCVKDTSGCCT